MNPAVVIGWNPCGDLRGREGAANIVPSRPRRARGHSAHINIVSTVPDWSVLTVVKGRLSYLCDWKPQTAENRFSRPMNSAGSQGARNLLAHTLIHLRQKSLSSRAEVFHSSILSAASRGLVGVFDGHEHAKGKMKCPTRVLKDLTKCL